MKLMPVPEVGDTVVVDGTSAVLTVLDGNTIYDLAGGEWQIQTPLGLGCFVWKDAEKAWLEKEWPLEDGDTPSERVSDGD